jgi:hypothetical protein
MSKRPLSSDLSDTVDKTKKHLDVKILEEIIGAADLLLNALPVIGHATKGLSQNAQACSEIVASGTLSCKGAKEPWSPWTEEIISELDFRLPNDIE